MAFTVFRKTCQITEMKKEKKLPVARNQKVDFISYLMENVFGAKFKFSILFN